MDRNVSKIAIWTVSKNVALRKESVDRNAGGWGRNGFGSVALRKESVDRNRIKALVAFGDVGRSPQGERG